MSYRLSDTTLRYLDRAAMRAQRDNRTPALAAGVACRGELLWDAAVGTADLSDHSVQLGVDTQFLIASNTKTFTAAMVMQLRDEGRLRLDDEVDAHVSGSAQPGVTIRQLLSHASGMQREPVGDVWETLQPPDPGRVIDDWNTAERVLAPHDRWHYSNLGYMLLGEIITRLDGRGWEESLQARLLDPLGLHRTTTTLQPPHTRQYYVRPFTDVPIEEPIIITGAFSPAGALASTVADLVRWHGFLLDPDASILSPDTVEEMRQPQLTVDPGWERAYGLGLYLWRRDGRIWLGHTGGAPGAITAAFSEPESGLTSILLTNNTATQNPGATAVALGTHVAEHDPPPLQAWVPGAEVPESLAQLTGLWFSEGNPFVFSVRQGRLEARAGRADASSPPSVFAAIEEDAYRTVSGDERGERLLVQRRADGSVRQLNWATYRFTREPLGFAETLD